MSSIDDPLDIGYKPIAYIIHLWQPITINSGINSNINSGINWNFEYFSSNFTTPIFYEKWDEFAVWRINNNVKINQNSQGYYLYQNNDCVGRINYFPELKEICNAITEFSGPELIFIAKYFGTNNTLKIRDIIKLDDFRRAVYLSKVKNRKI